eukprot:symbB.v1.2.041816.t1/scaffold8689.1/size5366/1
MVRVCFQKSSVGNLLLMLQGQEVDEQKFNDWALALNGGTPSTMGLTVGLRRLHFEAEIVLTSVLKASIEEPVGETAAPKSTPLAERNARLRQMRADLPGILIEGEGGVKPLDTALMDALKDYSTAFHLLRLVKEQAWKGGKGTQQQDDLPGKGDPDPNPTPDDSSAPAALAWYQHADLNVLKLWGGEWNQQVLIQESHKKQKNRGKARRVNKYWEDKMEKEGKVWCWTQGAADGTAGVAPSVIPEPVLPPGTEIVEEIVDDDEKKDEKKDEEKKDEEKKGDGDEDKEPKPEPEAKGPEK